MATTAWSGAMEVEFVDNVLNNLLDACALVNGIISCLLNNPA